MLVGNVHLIKGTAESIPSAIKMLEGEGLRVRGSADSYVRAYAQFGVDEARDIAERASSRPLDGARRLFILAMPDMTTEAQNALLKTLEEPPADAMFFFIVPSPLTLLPTLLSRMQHLALASNHAQSIVDIRAFLASTPTLRIDMLKALLEKDEDTGRDMSGIITFLSSLERMIGERVGERGMREALLSVYRARKYAGDKGSHLKSLLEHVALLTPVVQYKNG